MEWSEDTFIDSMGVCVRMLQLLGFANVSAPLDYVIDYSALCIEINPLNRLKNRAGRCFVRYTWLVWQGSLS